MIEKAIDSLNELLEADPEVILELANYRIKCNEKFANKPYVQVGGYKKGTTEFIEDDESEIEYRVGLLGMLNAVIEPLTGKKIMVVCELKKDRSTFIEISKFKEY